MSGNASTLQTNPPSLQIAFHNGYSIRARVETRDNEEQVLVGWWKPNGQPAAMEFWVPVRQGHAVFAMLAAFSEEIQRISP